MNESETTPPNMRWHHSISHNLVTHDFLLTIEAEDQPLGIDAYESPLWPEPDKTEYFKEWDLVYWLGPERGFISIDSEWLVFRFDGQKKVTDYKIMRD